MRDTDRKNRILRELADTIDIVRSKELLEPETNERKKSREVWRVNQLSAKSFSALTEMIELVVFPYGNTRSNTPRLLGFWGHLSTIFLDNDTYSSILYTTYPGDGSMVIAIITDPVKINKLITKLDAMPEVDNVEEKLIDENILPGSANESKTSSAPAIRPSKRFIINLREAVPAESELVPA